jgi:hypothetical protein
MNIWIYIYEFTEQNYLIFLPQDITTEASVVPWFNFKIVILPLILYKL